MSHFVTRRINELSSASSELSNANSLINKLYQEIGRSAGGIINLDSPIEPGMTKVLFLCRWAAPERMDLPDDVLAVEMKCSGRITPSLIIEAARKGIRSIMICGCDEKSCHYSAGRSLAAAAADRARDVLRLLGYGERMIAESSCDPGSFHDAVRTWARRRR